MDPAERRLAEKFLSGEAKAVECVQAWVTGACSRYRSRLAEDLEDLHQEIMLDVFRSLESGSFREAASLRTFVSAIAYNRCVSRIRWHANRSFLEVAEDTLTVSRDEVVHEHEGRHLLREVQQHLEDLPKPCKVIWTMLSDGARYREIAEELGLSEVATRSRAFRCRQQIVQRLRRRGLRLL